MAWTTDKIKETLDSDKIVIFAKGTRDVPRCGFSARAIQVVGSLGKPFKVVDIFSDPTIRPALVAHSEWPTTPQVYLDGVLLGGSDILLELHQSGDLQKQVAQSFGEEYKETEENDRVLITPEAAKKVQAFMEGEEYFLRLDVSVKKQERVYALELDTRSHAAADMKWTVGGVTVVVEKRMEALFDKLEVSWVNNNGQEGFAVKEVGTAPVLPTPLDIEKADLARILKKEPPKTGKVWVVDVREIDEWKSGYADGAIHLPLSNLEKGYESVGFAKEDTIVCYCARGGRSTKAAQFLRSKGFEKTQSLVGGVNSFPFQIVKD